MSASPSSTTLRSAVLLVTLSALAGCGGARASTPLGARDAGAPPSGLDSGDADAGDAAPPLCGTDCTGLPCGATCTSVFSDGLPSGCEGFTLTGFCDGDGGCTAALNAPPPPSCVVAACSGMTCGDACALAGKSGNCDAEGICRTDALPTCPGWDPCAAKTCGAACDLCPPNTTCAPHPGLCLATGACIESLPPGCHECTAASDCTAAPTLYCTTGAQVSIPPTCTPQMTCAYTTPTPADCGTPMCGAWDSSHTPATPSCTNDFGWQWTGTTCVDVVGCLFQGTGQTTGFPSQAVCTQAMAVCMP